MTSQISQRLDIVCIVVLGTRLQLARGILHDTLPHRTVFVIKRGLRLRLISG